MIWKLELSEAIYNPNYVAGAMRPRGLQSACLSLNDRTGKSTSATIMNWTRETFFVVLNRDENIDGEVEVNLVYQNICFEFSARVVTKSKRGLGLRVVDETKASSLNWLDFYDIISDRGISPSTV